LWGRGDHNPTRVDSAAPGGITIQGMPVAPQKADLEIAFKLFKNQVGRDNVVISAAPETPYHVAAMIWTAAQSVGLHHLSFAPFDGPVNSQGPSDGRTTDHADRTTTLRPPFDGRVERINVGVGEVVKKGDPLLQIVSADLAAAKGDYEMAVSQWKRDKKIYDYKRPMGENYMRPNKEMVEVENDEAQSRLRMKLARDKLLIYGLNEAEIEQSKNEEGMQKARFTLRSPVDGTVIEVGAVPGNVYDTKDTLMKIGPTPDHGQRGPRR
jgi:biotin carboxyl carrier protein